jgi:hypothetical protein
MRTIARWAVALAAAATVFVVPVPAQAATTGFGTRSFSKDNADTPRVVAFGSLTSSNPVCLRHRKMTLRWKHDGATELVGLVYSNSDGTYRIETDGPALAVYVLDVKEKDVGSVHCGPAQDVYNNI